MQQYFDNILSKYQCRFHKGFNLPYRLFTMTEKRHESVDKDGALIIDLSKPIDCLPHQLSLLNTMHVLIRNHYVS